MLEPVHDTPADVKALFTKLEMSVGLKKGGAKTTQHKVKDHTIYSWKFNEWEYYKNLVPCQARGLFTEGERIVVRGYDKFFNMNEVPATKFETLEQRTEGPYELTVKENGCIIFISGLADGTIVVCSKHSTGERDDLTRNHAVEGERQLSVQLEKVGKSTKELAKTLFKANITLVAELCDDSFEEHILSYTEKEAGLYIHGINHNRAKFKTYAMKDVAEFSDAWGFKYVKSFQKDTFAELMKFLKDCELTGTFEGREIEGFVIRTTVKQEDFFFKFKFEQPYLLYRHFREVTKQFIAKKPYNEIIKKFTDVKHIIAKYLEFISEYFDQFPEKKDLYLEGHGIIEVRKAFLNKLGLSEISGINLLKINEELSHTVEFEKAKNKYVLIPIATIGCGKTTIAQTLLNLYGWPHIQNDNIQSKNKNKLVTDCLEQLVNHPVVFCDRNNHQKRERKSLFDQFDKFKLDYLSSNDTLICVCLNFVPIPVDKKQIFDVTLERIAKRGDNHQSIKSDSDPELAKKILGGFVDRLQPLNTKYEPDNGFDVVVNVNYKDDTEVSVKRILDTLTEKFPDILQPPEEEQLKEAIKKAYEYQPSFTKTFGASSRTKKTKKSKGTEIEGQPQEQEQQNKEKPQKQKNKQTKQVKEPKTRTPDYYGVKVDHPAILDLLNSHCSNNDLWNLLKSIDRVQKEFHVTLAHQKAKKGNPDEWASLGNVLGASNKESGFVVASIYASVVIKSIILSDKLICLEAQIVEFQNTENEPLTLPILTERTHITIGTMDTTIKPQLSNNVLEEIHKQPKSTIYDITVADSPSKAQVIPIEEMTLHNQQLFVHYI